jgi:hypothetical protein
MRKIWENKTRSFKETEEFDDRFWRRAGASARFVATWMMVMEWQKMRGKKGGQPRLRRSVQSIKRIPH